MKTFFMSLNSNPSLMNFWLLVLRFAICGFMLVHGWPKLEKILKGGPILFGDPLGVGKVNSLYLTVFAEVFCSLLLAIGLFTRMALVPLIITMGVAVFIVHAHHGFGKQELALLYFLFYITLMITGPGTYSLDQYFLKRK